MPASQDIAFAAAAADLRIEVRPQLHDVISALRGAAALAMLIVEDSRASEDDRYTALVVAKQTAATVRTVLDGEVSR